MDGPRPRPPNPPPPNRCPRAAAVLAAAAIVATAAAGPPGPSETARLARSLASLDREAAADHALDQLLPRDRADDRTLREATLALKAGEERRAFELLQSLLDRPHDTFGPPDSMTGRRPSLCEAAESLLAADAARLLRYRRRVAEEARRAAEDGDIDTLQRRFALTPIAIEAQLVAARIALDCGRFSEARRRAARLLARPAVLSRPQLDAAASLVQRANPGRSPSADRTVSLVSFTTAAPLPASDPPLLRPLWSLTHDAVDWANHPSAGGRLQTLAQTLQRGDHVGPRTAAIAGDVVYVRDFHGLSARALQDGHLLWRHRTRTPVAALLRQDTPRNALEATVLRDTTCGTPVVSGGRVYLVERHDCGAGLTVLDASTGSVCWRSDDGVALGPAVESPAGLLAVREREGVVVLDCLNAADGETRWSQSLSVPAVPAVGDELRPRMAVVPVVSGDTAVCGTHLGVTVAIDLNGGRLRWAVMDSDLTAGQGGRPRSAASRLNNPPAFANPPLVRDGVVYLMPPQSETIRAVSLESGHELWTADRRGAVTLAGPVSTPVGAVLVSLGERTLRGLDATDGGELFAVRTPPVRGRPVVDGSLVWAATNSGRMFAVSAEGGVMIDDRLMRAAAGNDATSEGAGHLTACGTAIIRCGAGGITVFPRLSAVRRDAAERIAAGEAVAAAVRLARVDLASGDPLAASQRLQRVLPAVVGKTGDEPVEHLLQESLLAVVGKTLERRQPDEAAESALATLAARAVTPTQHVQALLAEAEYAAACGDGERAAHAGIEVARAAVGDAAVTMLQRLDHGVRSDAVASRILRRCVDAGTLDPARSDALAGLSASASERVGEEILCRLLPRHPSTEPVRLRRAERLMRQQRWHEAELLLLTIEGDAARSTLARLYAIADRPRSAARQLLAAETPIEQAVLLTAENAADVRREFVRLTARRPAAATASIAVTEREPPPWANAYANPRSKVTAPPWAGFDLVDGGTAAPDRSVAELKLIDRTSAGAAVRSIPVPASYWHPTGRPHARAGHLLPLAAESVCGVSLLSGEVAWQTPAGATRGKVAVCTSALTVVQRRETLEAFDTATGELLWRRTDMDARGGLLRDEHGVFGDETALAFVESDGYSVVTLDPWTGDRTGRHPLTTAGEVMTRGTRVAGGHRLAYVVTDRSRPGKPECQLRVFDAASGHVQTLGRSRRVVVDAVDTPSGRLLAAMTCEGDLTVLPLSGRGERLSVAMGVDAGLDIAGVNVMVCGEMLVVDVCRVEASAQSVPTSTSLRTASRAVCGHLYGVRRGGPGGEVVWRADPGRGAILRGPEDSPVLLHLTRLRSRSRGRDVRRLTVLNVDDGRVLATADGLPPATWLRLSESPDRRTLRLEGAAAVAEVRLD